MNKTIIINISGVIFHIEEDAYQLLQGYMDQIKKHFERYKDNLEIVSDIENRIAEMLSDLLVAQSKQVITKIDVDTVTLKMGKPAEFETGYEEEYEASADYEKPFRKKLFRDTEDRFIGGVCAGIGHYFNVEARWVRIAFVLMFIFYGFGLLPYALLWIVMPKAKSRTEKMEMKGEKINLQAFKKNIEEELNAVKSNLSNVKENVPGVHRIGSFIRDVVDGFLAFLGLTGRVVLKFVGIFLIIVVAVLLTVAFVFLMVFLGYAGNTDIATIFPLNIINEPLRPIMFICAFLVVVVPLLTLLFLLLKLIFNSKTISKSLSFSLAAVWILAVATGIFCIAKNATEFKEEASYNETVTLKTTPGNTYILRLGDERTIQENISGDEQGQKIITIAGSDRDFDTPNDFSFDLKVSEGDSPILSKIYSARGSNFNQALHNAHQIDYYYHQKDSLLTFDYEYGLNGATLWRSQKVDIKLQIPINSNLFIEKRMARKLFWYQLDDCIDEHASDDTLIPIEVTKNGFTCRKTMEAIKRQKEHNTENNIEEEVTETVLF